MSVNVAPAQVELPSRFEDTRQSQVAQTETHLQGTPAPKPVADTPEAQLRQITKLMNRYDTVGALDRIVRLLDRNPTLNAEMTNHLRYLGEYGVNSLRETGQKSEASYYSFRLSLFDPQPETPKPAFKFNNPQPAYA